uniref:Uncharacterized protein n=1 Tax=Sphaerodactylus townsendi TaxID=933632 RepID=A0ACB8FQZ3_9SAUR
MPFSNGYEGDLLHWDTKRSFSPADTRELYSPADRKQSPSIAEMRRSLFLQQIRRSRLRCKRAVVILMADARRSSSHWNQAGAVLEQITGSPFPQHSPGVLLLQQKPGSLVLCLTPEAHLSQQVPSIPLLQWINTLHLHHQICRVPPYQISDKQFPQQGLGTHFP